MKKFADVEEWRESVKKEIQSNGVHIVAKSTACDCEECLKEGISKGNSYTSLLDGYVHSIGFHQQGLPEVIILAGSNGVEETELTKEQRIDLVTLYNITEKWCV